MTEPIVNHKIERCPVCGKKRMRMVRALASETEFAWYGNRGVILDDKDYYFCDVCADRLAGCSEATYRAAVGAPKVKR